MKILIAEDERNFGQILRAELEDEGYDVTLTPDGLEAVLRFIDGDYDFVLMDIKMPKLDGITALKIIKKLKPNVPAITYSGNAGSGEIAESIKAGALRCITKPFEIAQLKNDIKNYVSRHGRI